MVLSLKWFWGRPEASQASQVISSPGTCLSPLFTMVYGASVPGVLGFGQLIPLSLYILSQGYSKAKLLVSDLPGSLGRIDRNYLYCNALDTSQVTELPGTDLGRLGRQEPPLGLSCRWVGLAGAFGSRTVVAHRAVAQCLGTRTCGCGPLVAFW